MTATTHSSPFSRYVAIAKRRMAIILAATVLVPLAALAVSLIQPDKFEATSSVLLSRQSLANLLSGTTDPGNNQQSFQQIRITQAKLARTEPVAADALKKAGVRGRGIDVFLDQSTVEASPDSDLVLFRVADGRPETARELATGYAEAFVEYRRRLDTASLDVALEEVERAEQAAGGGDARSLRSGLAEKQQELQTLRALQTSNAQVVERPSTAVQVQPRPVRSIVIGLILGVMLGVALALLRDKIDTRVRSANEIDEVLGLPLLSRITTPQTQADGTPELAMLTQPMGVQAEGFRILHMNLRFMNLDRAARTLMVSSASQGEGKSTTLANLAVAMARAGESVVLVDLDLRRPRVASLFDIRARDGLTDVVLGAASLDDTIVQIPLDAARSGQNEDSEPSLAVLPAGRLPPDPPEFINSAALAEVVSTLRSRYDVVLVDAPPIVGVSDPMILTGVVDALFLCARVGTMRRPSLMELRRVLDSIRIPALGYVMTGAEAEDSGHGYGYGYGYEAQVENGTAAPPRESVGPR